MSPGHDLHGDAVGHEGRVVGLIQSYERTTRSTGTPGC